MDEEGYGSGRGARLILSAALRQSADWRPQPLYRRIGGLTSSRAFVVRGQRGFLGVERPRRRCVARIRDRGLIGDDGQLRIHAGLEVSRLIADQIVFSRLERENAKARRTGLQVV